MARTVQRIPASFSSVGYVPIGDPTITGLLVAKKKSRWLASLAGGAAALPLPTNRLKLVFDEENVVGPLSSLRAARVKYLSAIPELVAVLVNTVRKLVIQRDCADSKL